ncbi:hypothetical protein [Sanguibacter suaedae]|uniref:Universal stress protein n=1 Tax=Sanguibacter suaedae TaxID=2795737 RepID=A0A934IE50_9MICO|nr:hypothetical protein [Sanguibacter suaedae]MBI9115284.1 hypothetical protein [Sanguibacter suaedae]
MTETILVLTEDTLDSSDVQHIVGLHPDDELDYRVLVPADTERSMLGSIIDHLASWQLKEAWEDATSGEPSEREARAEASEQLAGSIAEFQSVGAVASGTVVEDDPLPALRTAVAAGSVREIVVVTYPHALEDTFRRDWASRAREELHVPVLHLYTRTSTLG